MKRTSQLLLIIFGLALLLVYACGPRQNTATPQSVKKIFKTPPVPSVISDPEQKLQYQLTHFWDLFDFADSVWIKEPQIADAFAYYTSLLHQVPSAKAQESLRQLVQHAAAHDSTFLQVLSLANKFIYNPNAPYHHDENYLYLIELVYDAPCIPDSTRSILQSRHEMLAKNRVGTRATNFSFETLQGTKHLYDFRSPMTIVYFYNPGCPACEELSGRLAAIPPLQEYLRDKKIMLLSICMEADLQAWIQNKKHSELWVDGYDSANLLHTQRLYDLKAIPCLYLLGKNHEVILKDPTLEEMMQRIFQ